MFGYFLNVRVGAALYNLVHTLTLPLTLLLVSYIQHSQPSNRLYGQHTCLDRLLGYGLKYPTFFKDTHLQHIS